MNNQIKCKSCNKEIDISVPHTEDSDGYECQSCTSNWAWAFIRIALVLIMLIFGIVIGIIQ